MKFKFPSRMGWALRLLGALVLFILPTARTVPQEPQQRSRSSAFKSPFTP